MRFETNCYEFSLRPQLSVEAWTESFPPTFHRMDLSSQQDKIPPIHMNSEILRCSCGWTSTNCILFFVSLFFSKGRKWTTKLLTFLAGVYLKISFILPYTVYAEFKYQFRNLTRVIIILGFVYLLFVLRRRNWEQKKVSAVYKMDCDVGEHLFCLFRRSVLAPSGRSANF